MSDPTEGHHTNPHPISGHRTPEEIAADEAGPIGQADPDVVTAGGAETGKSPDSGALIEPPDARDSLTRGKGRGST